MKSIKAPISDALIRRNKKNDIRQITDTRYPVKFRYHKNRDKGSWYFVKYIRGTCIWRKIASYPAVNTTVLFKRLPDIAGQMIVDHDTAFAGCGFSSCDDLFFWYRERTSSAGYLSKKRRAAIKSMLDKHLIPKLGGVCLSVVDRVCIDDKLIQAMQGNYSVEYIRQVFDVLRLIFKQAYKLKIVNINPLFDFKFSDFIDTPVKVKEGKIKRNDLPLIFSSLEIYPHWQSMLPLLMLMHGTRIGETRKSRWDYIDWVDRRWIIPGSITKNGDSNRVPLTDVAAALLKMHRANQEYMGYRGVFLFPNRSGGFISETRADQVIVRLSSANWTSHDLRKMARTAWADLGVDYMVSERLLNHRLSKLDQTYVHTYVETQKRAALEKYHNWLRQYGLDAFLSGV